MSFGPYNNGDTVYVMTRSGMGGGILYGMVFDAGPKRFSIMWEANYVSRYEQTYYMSRSDFRCEGQEYGDKIKTVLRNLIEDRKKAKNPVHRCKRSATCDCFRCRRRTNP